MEPRDVKWDRVEVPSGRAARSWRRVDLPAPDGPYTSVGISGFWKDSLPVLLISDQKGSSWTRHLE